MDPRQGPYGETDSFSPPRGKRDTLKRMMWTGRVRGESARLPVWAVSL